MKIIFTLLLLFLLTAAGFTQALPNYDFETWEGNLIPPYEDPEFWNTPNLYTSGLGGACVTKSEDAYSGNYSARLETVEILQGMFRVPGLLTYGELVINIFDTSYNFYGGVPMNEKVQSLSGQYKFQGVDGDSAMVLIYTYSHPEGEDLDTIGLGYSFLHDADEWTAFKVDMTYLNHHTPDTFNVLILSSGTIQLDEIKSGSVLQVDSLTIETGVGISDKYQVLDLNVYPNPATEYICFETGKTALNRRLIVYNMQGRKIREIAFTDRKLNLDLRNIPPGSYTYRILNETSLQNSGMFVVQ